MTTPKAIHAEPADEAYETAGMTNYSLDEVLAEFIDNSLSATTDANSTVSVTIDLFVDGEMPKRLVIEDNGKGIEESRIKDVIALGKKNAQAGSFNEHGMGLKQAAWFLGKNHTIETTTKGQTNIVSFSPLKTPTYVKYAPKDSPGVSLTRITIELNQDSKVFPITDGNTKKLISLIGARYRRFIEPQGENPPKLKIDYRLHSRSSESDPYELTTYPVNAVKPYYFKSDSNQPYVYRKSIVDSSRKWEVELTVGLAPNSDYQWDQIGVPKEKRPIKGHPYHVCLERQGLDILIRGRVLLFHQLHEVDLVNTAHNRFNLIRGEINLIKGFKTQRTKNGIVKDANWHEMIQRVKCIIQNKDPQIKTNRDLLERSDDYDYEDVDEVIFHKRVADMLKSVRNMNPNGDQVQVMKPVAPGLDLKADIILGDSIWEIKKAESPPLDVMQLAMYLIVANLKKGTLVSASFKQSTRSLVPIMKEKFGLDINLVEHRHLNIARPMTDEEIKWQESGGFGNSYDPKPTFDV